MKPKYNRVLLKLSGEALSGRFPSGIDFETVQSICLSVKECVDAGVQVGMVIGGGNFWRGRTNGQMNRVRADHIGMLATMMNSLAVADTLEAFGVNARVQSAIDMNKIAESYVQSKAVKHLEKGAVVIFACGTGSPFFSTDTAAALRAAEINAEVVLKATMVDGVYDCDPKQNKLAQKYDTLTFSEVLSKNLKVIDSTAASLCKDNDIKLLVFDISEPSNIVKAIAGENVGTIVR